MDLTLVRSGIPDLLPMKRGGDESRHISVVIRKLCLALGHYEEREGGITEEVQTMFEMGSTFEDAIVHHLTLRYAQSDPHRYVKTGELELDDLYGNPDLYDALEDRVIEMKLTKLSSRHDPEGVKFWKYWTQLKAYCRMMETTRGQLHVCFINGNYKNNGPGYDYRVWNVEFTKQELIENWRMIRSHAA